MIKRHEHILMARLDEVGNVGWSVIHWWEAYLWYGAERLGKRFYRDLRDRYREENEGDICIYSGPASLLLVQNEGLAAISEKLGETDLEE